jgi:hypothetical protein
MVGNNIKKNDSLKKTEAGSENIWVSTTQDCCIYKRGNWCLAAYHLLESASAFSLEVARIRKLPYRSIPTD